MWTERDVTEAMNEIAIKTLTGIQEETAYKWGARAMAALRLAQATNNAKFLADACEYRHESLEHAALAGPQIYLSVRAGLVELDGYL